MWLLFLCLAAFHSVHGSCPAGWDLVSQGQCRGHVATKYDVYWNNDAINAAIQACNAVSAHTISIHNDEQQQYWTSKSPSKNSYLALGLTCYKEYTKWQYPDGTPFNYKPRSYNSALDRSCIFGCTWYIKDDGYWEIGCDNTHKFTEEIYCYKNLEQPQPSGEGCDSFQDDSADGICYQIGATAVNWQDAQNICRSFAGDVASIHSDQANSFVRRLAVSKGAVNGVYLGATISQSGRKWLDQSAWNYSHFYPGFPVVGLGECLVMDTSTTSGEWVNVDCSTKQAVACERKQHYTTPGCSSGHWKEGDIIYSPGFPVSSSIPCDYILQVAPGRKVQVEILMLEANSCCDHLILYENYIGAKVIANLTGEVNDKKFSTMSSNFMRISWQPNGGYNVRGVIFTYRAM